MLGLYKLFAGEAFNNLKDFYHILKIVPETQLKAEYQKKVSSVLNALKVGNSVLHAFAISPSILKMAFLSSILFNVFEKWFSCLNSI